MGEFLLRLQGYLLQGLAYQQMNKFKDAIHSLLTALDLEPDNADRLTNHIAATVARFCNISKDLAKSLKGRAASGVHFGRLTWVGLQQLQEQNYSLLYFHVCIALVVWLCVLCCF